MYTHFDLSYKKQSNGRYLYYPYSPMIGWAYDVTEIERDRLMTARIQQSMVAATSVVAMIPFAVAGNTLGAGLAFLAALALVIGVGRYQTRRILGSRGLVRCAAATTYPNYLKKLGLGMSSKEIWVDTKGGFVGLALGAWSIYWWHEHGGIGYLIGGTAASVLCLYLLLCLVYVLHVRRQRKQRDRV